MFAFLFHASSPSPPHPLSACSYEVRSDVPSELFHGTSQNFLAAIFETGLSRMSRQFVHLTLDLETASKVGTRLLSRPKIVCIESHFSPKSLHSPLADFYVTGSRHTKSSAEVTILRIDAAQMHADGLVFHCSENQVWLTERVPSKYLSVLPRSRSK